MKPIYRRTLFALAIAAMPAVAFAEDAFTLQQTDIFAGPSSEFPPIASLPPNTEVGVAGCLSDWSWCDVTFANDRGWVWAGDLGYPYQGNRVAIIEFGPRLHLPVVTFSINTYWDAHYRSRPFFRERDVWVSRVHVEGSHGGKAPHGGTRVAQPSGGAQAGATAQAREAKPAPAAQGQAQVQGGAQVQGAQPQPRPEQGAQAEQRSREQAQTAQRSREQAQPPQAQTEQRSREETAKSQQRPQPEASRSMQGEQHAQPSDQHASSRGMTQEQPGKHEGQEAAQSKSRGETAATHPEPDRGASAKGPQGERPKD